METELPIPNETQQVIRRLRLGSSGLILETILREFFTLESDNCWHNSRCDQEIKKYKDTSERISNYWNSLPREVRTSIERHRQAAKINATPSWLSEEQKLEILEFYILAKKLTKKTGIKHEVDHIIPLRGNGVRGLHVPWNLQTIPAFKNRQKGNR